MDKNSDVDVAQSGRELFTPGSLAIAIQYLEHRSTELLQCSAPGVFEIRKVVAEFMSNDDAPFLRRERPVDKNCSVFFERDKATMHLPVCPWRPQCDATTAQPFSDEGGVEAPVHFHYVNRHGEHDRLLKLPGKRLRVSDTVPEVAD